MRIIMFQLEHISQHLGGGSIQLMRNFLSDFGIVVQRAGKRRCAHDGDLVLLGQLNDALGGT